MLEKIGEMSVLLYFCCGIAVGKLCSLYVIGYLKKRGVRESKKVLYSPAPEIAHGLLWGITALARQQQGNTPVYCLLCSVLFGIAVVDFYIYEIPLLCNGIIAGLGLLQIGLDAPHSASYLMGAFLGGGLFLLVYLLTRKRGIGGGDVKLMAAAGLLLGAPKILYALFFGCLIAVLVQLPLKWFCKKNSTFALGPYLVVGILGLVWFGDKILQWEQLLG